MTEIARYKLKLDVSSDIFEKADEANVEIEEAFSSLTKVDPYYGSFPAATVDEKLCKELSKVDLLYISADAEFSLKFDDVLNTAVTFEPPETGKRAVVFLFLKAAAAVYLSCPGDVSARIVGGEK